MARVHLVRPLLLAALALGVCAGGGSSALAAHSRSFRAGAGAPGRHGHRARGHRRRSARRSACSDTTLVPNARNLALVRAATLCLINRERAAHGERRLRANARLTRAAQAHSDSMAARDYFEHTGPGGLTPLARMRAVGYLSSARGYEVGENIAWGTRSLATPHAIVVAWMASPGHRANILDPRYRETGVGVVPHPPSRLAGGQPGAIYTQDFGVIIGR